MLPIRFIAESFGLDVSWNEYSKTVTVKNRIEKGADDLILPDSIPPYSGAPYIELNGGKPFFSSFDYVEGDFEEYSELDSLNRCGVAFANISTETMPTEKRGSIGMIKPSGWHTVRYEGIDQDYLYNRCHLIGYQLAGENDNDKNLITGTRYMNTEGMLPFENKVAEYVRNTGNHVLYRSTPIFEGENLLANGVILEASSVEDRGKGISFNVFCYNVQPGIEIDYKTGDSSQTAERSNPSMIERSIPEISEDVTYIANTNTKKFHYPSCDSVKDMKDKNKEELYCTREEAIAKGYSPCGRCKP